MNEDETAPRSSRIVSAVGRWIASIAGSEGVWASMSSLDRQRRGLRCSPFSTGASVSSPSVGALESRPEQETLRPSVDDCLRADAEARVHREARVHSSRHPTPRRPHGARFDAARACPPRESFQARDRSPPSRDSYCCSTSALKLRRASSRLLAFMRFTMRASAILPKTPPGSA